MKQLNQWINKGTKCDIMNVEELNRKLKKEFDENKNYYTLERYVMSELLTPIEDFENVVDIIKKI